MAYPNFPMQGLMNQHGSSQRFEIIGPSGIFDKLVPGGFPNLEKRGVEENRIAPIDSLLRHWRVSDDRPVLSAYAGDSSTRPPADPRRCAPPQTFV